jgi:hypothetical protein
MDAKKLIELRTKAEKAIEAMPDGELKVKAFEVILSHLLTGTAAAVGRSTSAETLAAEPEKEKPLKVAARSLSGRILVLRNEGFFKAQKSIGQIREELKAHGWYYPVTTLSGTLQAMAQKGHLRRERVRQGKRKVWLYSNP